MYVYIYIYTHTYIHQSTHPSIHTRTSLCSLVPLFAYVWLRLHLIVQPFPCCGLQKAPAKRLVEHQVRVTLCLGCDCRRRSREGWRLSGSNAWKALGCLGSHYVGQLWGAFGAWYRGYVWILSGLPKLTEHSSLLLGFSSSF